MQYRNITDGRISALGLGGLRFPEQEGRPGIIDRKKAQPVVDAAISCGINCFDTAYSYQDGDSERFLGEALAGYPRNEYLLSTKFYVAYSEDIEGNAVPTAATLRRFCLAVRKHDIEYSGKPAKRFFMANNHDIARIGKLLFEKEYCDM